MPSFRVLHISSPIRDLARLSPFDHPHAGVTDRFHLPCPHSPAAYLKSCGVPDNQTSSDPAVPQDYVSQLPTEISDRIFTLLDPSALDAARFTSRAWWDRIMGSHWILSRVLAAKHDHIPGTESWLPTKLGRAENLQGLPWRFNDSSILTVGWSAEYRKYTYDFALPEAPNPTSINKPRQLTDPMSDHHIVSADFSTSGKMMAFLVRGPPRPDLEAYANFSISLYCVFPPDPPVLIKSIACPVGDTPYRIQLVDVDPGQTWAAKVSCPSKTVSFSIWPRASFAKSASPYEVSEDFVSYDQGLQDRPGRVNQDDFMNYSRNDAPTREVHWRLLERLPSVRISPRRRLQTPF